MTRNVADAILILQHKSKSLFHSNYYYTEVIDRALDYLLRNIHLKKRPEYLARNAIANAKKTINQRLQICSVDSLQSFGAENIPNRHSRKQSVEEFWAFKDWFERTELTSKDRLIIDFLMRGKTEQNLAQYWNISVKQARVRICRTKKRISQLWQTDSNL